MNVKRFQLITASDINYEAATSLIESVYRSVFQAHIRVRPTMLLTLSNQSGDASELVACVTLSTGLSRKFFSEAYLPEPAEKAIEKALGWPVEREQIVEIGGLAASKIGAGVQLVNHTPWFVLGLGHRYGLVTATSQVRFLLRHAGMEFIPMATAKRDVLPNDDRTKWGTYYDNEPITGAIDFLVSSLAAASHRTQRYAVQEISLSVHDLKAG